MYAYCLNMPVRYKDDSGMALVTAFEDCGYGNPMASMGVGIGGGGGAWTVYSYAGVMQGGGTPRKLSNAEKVLVTIYIVCGCLLIVAGTAALTYISVPVAVRSAAVTIVFGASDGAISAWIVDPDTTIDGMCAGAVGTGVGCIITPWIPSFSKAPLTIRGNRLARGVGSMLYNTLYEGSKSDGEYFGNDQIMDYYTIDVGPDIILASILYIDYPSNPISEAIHNGILDMVVDIAQTFFVVNSTK